MRRAANIFFEKMQINNMIREELIKRGDLEGIHRIDVKIVESKREYRKELKRDAEPRRICGGIVVNGGGDWDSRWTKVFFPGETWTDEEKDQFVAAVWIPYRWTDYDCTGQLFTQGVEVFNVPSGVVAYIMEGLDV